MSNFNRKGRRTVRKKVTDTLTATIIGENRRVNIWSYFIEFNRLLG